MVLSNDVKALKTLAEVMPDLVNETRVYSKVVLALAVLGRLGRPDEVEGFVCTQRQHKYR